MFKNSPKIFTSINNENNVNQRHYYDLTISETLSASADQSKRSLKTFAGVFCPVALAQFSSLMFLRLGMVIGQTGLLLGILQLMIAYCILVLTVLSICAISTNGAIKGGGVYFMISRTLGPEVGGSIGILFFLGNVFSSALYFSGFVEGLIDDFGPEGRITRGVISDSYWWIYLFASCVSIFCLAVCLIGGSMFAKTNLIIFMVTFVCFLSVIVTFLFHPPVTVQIPKSNKHVYPNPDANFSYANFTGLNGLTLKNNLYAKYNIDFTTGKNMDFLSIFAILFAGVTGIMNGANMSGELKQPAYSLPRGTLGATLFTFISYVISALLTAATCDRYLLWNNYLYMQAVNFWKPFVMIGIFATCLSAGLGNFIGASRILYALAKDDIFGILLRPAQITTKGGNPIASVLISFVLIQAVLFVGKLNYIAPIVSVFFLLAYASVNCACGLLDLASASNFRPTFKYFSWHTSMLGVVFCLGMCFFVNYQYAIGIFILFFVLIAVLNFRHMDYAWGSIGQALLYHQVRKYLLLIDTRKEHVKYWRPQVLLLISNPRSQATLVQFVNLLKKGGLYVIGHVIKADFETVDVDPALEMQKNFVLMKDFLKVKAFIDVTTAPTIRDGCRQLARLCGLGGMSINTVCLGFRDNSQPKDVLKEINTYMINNTRIWPFKFRQRNPFISEMTSNVSEEPSSSRLKEVATSLEDTTDAKHFKVVVDENSPLVTRKGMKYFGGILRSTLDTRFIEDLPRIRKSRSDQADTGYVNDIVDDSDDGDEETYEQIGEMEYVGIIADCSKLQKNICLCRYFEKINLMELKDHSSSDKQYIDVWPVNFFQPGSGSYLDKTCMFMLQLSCILKMSPQWSAKGQIRVHICLDYYTMGADGRNIKQLWNELLMQWRIQAEIKTVSWDDIIMNLEHTLGRKIMPSVPSSEDTKSISHFDCTLPNSYVQEVNNIIASHTSQYTVVSLFYLPELPDITKSVYWKKYIDQITLLTNDLPSSVLVRGQHEVITSAL